MMILQMHGAREDEERSKCHSRVQSKEGEGEREREREEGISTYQNAHDLDLNKNVVPHHCEPSLRIIHESVFTIMGKKVDQKVYKNKHEML